MDIHQKNLAYESRIEVSEDFPGFGHFRVKKIMHFSFLISNRSFSASFWSCALRFLGIIGPVLIRSFPGTFVVTRIPGGIRVPTIMVSLYSY